MGQPSKIGREILTHLSLSLKLKMAASPPTPTTSAPSSGPSSWTRSTALFLEIGLNGDGERNRQEIAVFVDLLGDVVVVELEVGGGKSVDEVAGAIRHGSWGDHQA